MRATPDPLPLNPAPTSRFWILQIGSFIASLAMALYGGMISNYALQTLQISPARYGLLDGIREVPGLLMAVLGALTARWREEYAFAAWGFLLAAGLLMHGWAGSFGVLVIATLVYSTGAHLWSISRNILVIDGAPEGREAQRIGQVEAAAAAAGVLALGAVWLLGDRWPLTRIFAAAGVLGCVAAAASLALGRSGGAAPRRAPLAWRRAYGPLYVLTALTAAREMVTITLATFLLVQVYRMPVQTMALLLAAENVLNMVLKPLAGRLTDRLGARRALVWNFAATLLLFVGYALIRNGAVLSALFVADYVLIGFAYLALSAYTGRVVPGAELGATLSLCSTLAHAVAVPLPLVLGVLLSFGTALPLAVGIGVAALALVYSSRR